MFKGKYGADKLGFVLIVSSIFVTLIAAVLDSQNLIMKFFLLAISAALLCFAVFRILSENTNRRKRELHWLEEAEYKVVLMFGRLRRNDEKEEQEDKDAPSPTKEVPKAKPTIPVNPSADNFKHFKCPKCKKPLKVPIGKGYIKVVCPACGNKFTKHT